MSKITRTTQRTLAETLEAIADDPTTYPFRLWRMVPAEDFDQSRRFGVGAHIAKCAIGDVEWRRAIAGDATCAIRIALRMEVPDEITYPVDATMTLLAYSALNGSAAAALVLRHLLRRMPIEGPLRDRLAKSWLVRNLGLASSDAAAAPRCRSRARRSSGSQPSGRKECRS